MNLSELKKFDFTQPGDWIAGVDRDWSSESFRILGSIKSQFVIAVTSYKMFEPLTLDTAEDYYSRSKYESCLNTIYATSFVFSLDAIRRLLDALNDRQPPAPVSKLIAEFNNHFCDLKEVRDSAAHIDERGRGLAKGGKELSSSVVYVGTFLGSHFAFTGSDGVCHSIEMKESTLLDAHRILQDIINAYPWK
jgi:hypothetical protein